MQVEDVRHFVMDCGRSDTLRTTLLTKVSRALESQASAEGTSFGDFSGLPRNEQFEVLLGKRIGNPQVEDMIDKYVKTFLELLESQAPGRGSYQQHTGHQVQRLRLQSATTGAPLVGANDAKTTTVSFITCLEVLTR